ncbi:DHA1 family multidrug resistance protein-like MFS transporter [Tepidibacillus fermentans]|uniref:DHA1 family multidrug resistance protein-like MFS transporter n=1 Tax=Tepidibacillus fermentans TaxID=1281767 RepID=A0A4R3K5Y4_9BACI|nr:MFS transporter [Tepidibacillus fermentans]TCS78236.1 DHA1 family multidrug resistance protein-like MFS transporter [Tepidibacillus fermentans]
MYILWGAVFLLMAAMSSIMPFLPLYIHQDMGIQSEEQVAMWSGLIFGANFLTAFLFSPLWGKLSDKYGRKIMILRSGFGMSIVISLMGLATNVYHLLLLRLLNGMIAGFNPAAIALVATNTPKERVGYALGMLRSGAVAGSIIGPFLGGFLADYIGFRHIFFYTGVLILIAAIIVLFMVKEDFTPRETEESGSFVKDFKLIAGTQPLIQLFVVAFMIQFATLNVNPVLPLFVQQLDPPGGRVSFFAGLVAAMAGFAEMMAAPRLGKLGDKIGPQKVLFYTMIGAALLFLPQGFSTNIWQLLLWRFLLGLTVGGLLPSVNALTHRFAPKGLESTTFGYSNSATFLGNMIGPITGGFLAGHIGLNGVFFVTAILLLLNGIWTHIAVNKRIKALQTSN